MSTILRIAVGSLLSFCLPSMLLADSLITRDDFVCYDTLESNHSAAMFPYIALDGAGLLYQVDLIWESELGICEYTRFDKYGNRMQPDIDFAPDTIRDTIWLANGRQQIHVNESGRAFIPHVLNTKKPSGYNLTRIFGRLTDQPGYYLEEPEICFTCDLPEEADKHFRKIPAGCINSNGVVGVAWNEQIVTSDLDVYWKVWARLYYSEGDSLGPPLVLSDLPSPVSNDPNLIACYYERSPAIAMADDGSFVVVWTVIVKRFNDMGQVEHGGRHIFYVIYEADCTPRTDVRIADCDGEFYDTSLCVTLKMNEVCVDMEADGDFYIMWSAASHDFTSYLTQRELWMRGFYADGSPKYFPVRVNDTDTLYLDVGLVNNPSLSCDDSGNVLVTWADARNHPDCSYLDIKRDMFAQKIDPDGNLVGPNYRVSNITGRADPFGVTSSGHINNAGQAVFTIYYQLGAPYRVYAQLMPYHEVGTFIPGDLNLDFQTDIGDLTDIIDHLFISLAGKFWPPDLLDLDGDGVNGDIADLTRLIRYLFMAGEEPVVPSPGVRPNPGHYIENGQVAGDIIIPGSAADSGIELTPFQIE